MEIVRLIIGYLHSSARFYFNGGQRFWTLDHKRLGAFRLSGLQEAPIQWANPNGQMTTTNIY